MKKGGDSLEKQMLRYTLEEMDRMGVLLECDREVNPEYEIGGVLKYFRNKRPILFNRVKGSSVKVAGGLYGDREIIYELLHMNHKNRLFKFMDAIANPPSHIR